MSNLLTLLIRILFLGVGIAAITYIPYLIWKLAYWNSIPNKAGSILLRVIVILFVVGIELLILTGVLASLWTIEQTSGTCFGFSCPIQ